MNPLTLHSAPNAAQRRAFSFVSTRITDLDANQWKAGYIHGLLVALIMTKNLTVAQACELETLQEQISCKALPRRAVGGAV